MGGTGGRVFLLPLSGLNTLALGSGLIILILLTGLEGERNVSLMALTVELNGSTGLLESPLAFMVVFS